MPDHLLKDAMQNSDIYIVDAIKAVKSLLETSDPPLYVWEERYGTDWVNHVQKPYAAYFRGFPQYVLTTIQDNINLAVKTSPETHSDARQASSILENYEDWYSADANMPLPSGMHSITYEEAQAITQSQDRVLDILLLSLDMCLEDYRNKFLELYPDHSEQKLPLQFRNRISTFGEPLIVKAYADVLKAGIINCQQAGVKENFREATCFVLQRSFWVSDYNESALKCPLGIVLNDLSSRCVGLNDKGEYEFTGQKYMGSFYAFMYEKIRSQLSVSNTAPLRHQMHI
jgi:hypothetical protein